MEYRPFARDNNWFWNHDAFYCPWRREGCFKLPFIFTGMLYFSLTREKDLIERNERGSEQEEGIESVAKRLRAVSTELSNSKDGLECNRRSD